MQELTQIESPAAHSCQKPRSDRWHVLEPVTGRWSWLTVYACCEQVYEEPSVAPAVIGVGADDVPLRKAA